MTQGEAMRALLNGQRVRRPGWVPGGYIYLNQVNGQVYFKSVHQPNGVGSPAAIEKYQDWEIMNDGKVPTLQDKRFKELTDRLDRIEINLSHLRPVLDVLDRVDLKLARIGTVITEPLIKKRTSKKKKP